jgi:hypothetical protein
MMIVLPGHLAMPAPALLTPETKVASLVMAVFGKSWPPIVAHAAMTVPGLLAVLNEPVHLVMGKPLSTTAPLMLSTSILMQVRLVPMVVRGFDSARDMLLTSYDALVHGSYCM